MTTIVWPFFVAVAAIGVGAAVLWHRHDMAKACIEADLIRARARDITISPVWLDFDRDTLTYEVEYTDAHGQRRLNRCKVNTSFDGDRNPYWASPL